ncbi:hypothetical protein IC757_10280 [Wenzhouxiangella sp. AB-CW3]|uniref:DUF6491 family protein n=1 Tax=Wenzhouxiangella sp. AB-CW3 TaxID=2771012 RepID=UPI00168ADF1B|nr:DUF6491 family protein [Wenzhouxiangella sp. AB-CW3]QOC21441.1 hypothetical protein IC757_10280 [Wenzhouxiangella sp. AB-CW3]
MKRPFLILLTLLLAGCAAQEPRPTLEQIEEVYLRHAGHETQSVMFSNIRGWRPAGVQSVAINFGARRDYLIDLAPPCVMDLRFEPMIRVVNSQRGTLSRFDRIQVGQDLCRIVRIRQIDMDAVREDLDQLELDTPGVTDRIREETTDQDSGGT